MTTAVSFFAPELVTVVAIILGFVCFTVPLCRFGAEIRHSGADPVSVVLRSFRATNPHSGSSKVYMGDCVTRTLGEIDNESRLMVWKLRVMDRRQSSRSWPFR